MATGRTQARQTTRWATICWGAALCVLALAACASPFGQSGTAMPSAQPTATIRATPTPGPSTPGTPPDASALHNRQIVATVQARLAAMTLDEKIGQLFLIETNATSYDDDLDTMVRALHAGALIIFNKNIVSPGQVRQLVGEAQAHTALPLLVSIDEEGGVVDRLGASGYDAPLPSAQALGASGDASQAYDAGARAAAEMTVLGINTDLAPVVDVRTTPNAFEYSRLYGNDPATVDRYAGAFLGGLQDHGVIGTLKHWPGVGSVVLDPHLTLPTLTASRSTLSATEFAAFRELLPQQPGIIMVTHVIVPALDQNLPATLSPAVVQGTLRDQLGYQGVVMTDSLYMQGIALHYTLPQAAVLAVAAGDDLLEGATDAASMRAMADALRAALTDGRISPSRLDDAVRHILTLKARYGLLPLTVAPTEPRQASAGGAAPPLADRRSQSAALAAPLA